MNREASLRILVISGSGWKPRATSLAHARYAPPGPLYIRCSLWEPPQTNRTSPSWGQHRSARPPCIPTLAAREFSAGPLDIGLRLCSSPILPIVQLRSETGHRYSTGGIGRNTPGAGVTRALVPCGLDGPESRRFSSYEFSFLRLSDLLPRSFIVNGGSRKCTDHGTSDGCQGPRRLSLHDSFGWQVAGSLFANGWPSSLVRTAK